MIGGFSGALGQGPMNDEVEEARTNILAMQVSSKEKTEEKAPAIMCLWTVKSQEWLECGLGEWGRGPGWQAGFGSYRTLRAGVRLLDLTCRVMGATGQF